MANFSKTFSLQDCTYFYKFNHYYQLIVFKFPLSNSILYVNSLDYLISINEKSKIWLFIELFHLKNIDKMLVNFRKENLVPKDLLYKLIHQLQRLFLSEFKINSSIYHDFLVYQDNNRNFVETKFSKKLHKEWEMHKNRIFAFKSAKMHINSPKNNVADENSAKKVEKSNESTPGYKTNPSFNDFTEANKNNEISDILWEKLYKDEKFKFVKAKEHSVFFH